jgi:hypothetical protein
VCKSGIAQDDILKEIYTYYLGGTSAL